MNSISSRTASTLEPYAGLLAEALPGAGYVLADARGKTLAATGTPAGNHAEAWLQELAPAQGLPHFHHEAGTSWLALELREANGAFAGWLLATWPESMNARLWPDPAAVAANRLLPLLALLARDVAAIAPAETAAAAPAEDNENIVVGWLREALEQDRMQLYAQRIMPLQDFKKPSGYELLVRLRDEDGHIVAPEEFLSAAYRYQLLPAVDRWVMEHAIEILSKVGNVLRTSDVSIAINVSGQSLGDQLFVQRLADRLSAARIPPARIMLEIAEQTAMANLPQAAEMMRQLRELGCGVALDDAGASPTSISVLDELAVSRIKLDRALVRDILTNGRSEETVKALVHAAKARKIETVAVFVENEGIARKVRSLGIDYGQGYMFARPEPLEQVLGAMQKDAARRANLDS